MEGGSQAFEESKTKDVDVSDADEMKSTRTRTSIK